MKKLYKIRKTRNYKNFMVKNRASHQPVVASACPDVPSLFLLGGVLLSPLWDAACDRNKNEQSGSSELCPAVSPSPFLSEYIIASEEIVDLLLLFT